ncbi:tyrosine-type recombinase/integrase [Sphingobium fuliginis]|jgi:site-specific recombinase XerD|uniref:Mobile element protein n=1 Tax=Sphingobium fuliginis (strain ATCC 27551) TaxID=336203 RepID=A0A292ZN72_SPHSA|nr:tyrosine-type recombinase/integrase [Sphingobium fuliginis]QOT70987.1 tyrosine-type recombinase/integrase [Sphingobium fuliginis]GAY24331.1 mobile element protein [Sphingobium fuliginis]
MTLDDFLNGSWTVRDLRAGPFRDCIDLYTARLRKDGYSTVTARYSVRIVNCFIQWLFKHRFDRGDISDQLVDRFFRDEDRGCGLRGGDPASIDRFVEVLREAGIVASAVPRPPSPADQILERFRAYLDHRHGLSARSCAAYIKFTRPFLRDMSIAGPDDFAGLTTADVLGYVERRARDASAATAVAMCSRLRSFLRYLQVEGLIADDLAACVPPVKKWRFTALPTYLSAAQLEQVLQHCDRSTASGRRDYAVLLLLSRLGLRAHEVATLKIDDIDWRAGQFRIRGKGRQQAIMPLPPDVGAAIAAYLERGRPVSDRRQVFLKAYPPHSGFPPATGIRDIAARALRRAGISDIAHRGSHIFRHSLATELLRSGAALTQISQVLRHKDADTTRIYAKVDLASLRTLSLPWPGGLQ